MYEFNSITTVTVTEGIDRIPLLYATLSNLVVNMYNSEIHLLIRLDKDSFDYYNCVGNYNHYEHIRYFQKIANINKTKCCPE